MKPDEAPRILLESSGITCVQSGPLVTVTLNRPEVRNALRPSTWAALAATGALVDESVRVVVLRGAGDDFCSGLDRRLLTGETVGEDAPLTRLNSMTHTGFDRAVATYQEGFVWLRDPRFISVAAVHGHTIGAGFQLALACDIRIATEDAKFCMREPALGLVPDLGGTAHLLRAVGYSRALEWTASARIIEADEALASGLVSALAPRGGLDIAIAKMATGLIGASHGAVSATKDLLLGAVDRPFEDQRIAERAAQLHRFAAMAAES
jgi:enoyl-CoA hydratase/carnithine racemase